jgi:hypothetical protein
MIMKNYASSSTLIAEHLMPYCASTLQECISDPTRGRRLDDLGRRVATLECFIRGYELIEDPSISTDDEILNWSFSEVPADLGSAIWSLATGFYKASAASLRNAYDIGVASLYFQIRENTDTGNHAYAYNQFFTEWDSGAKQTPNWGEMKGFISQQPSVRRFATTYGVDPVEEAYTFFKHLCAFTHTSAYTRTGEPVTAINTTGTSPAFDPRYFDRGCLMTEKTMSYIAALWQIAFPQIMATHLARDPNATKFACLFQEQFGGQARMFR